MGYGGWDNGDEFIFRMNKLFVDGEEVFKIIFWRIDCVLYCLFNLVLGNFFDGFFFSDLSWLNWCSGMLIFFYIIFLIKFKKGKYVLEVVIE